MEAPLEENVHFLPNKNRLQTHRDCPSPSRWLWSPVIMKTRCRCSRLSFDKLTSSPSEDVHNWYGFFSITCLASEPPLFENSCYRENRLTVLRLQVKRHFWDAKNVTEGYCHCNRCHCNRGSLYPIWIITPSLWRALEWMPHCPWQQWPSSAEKQPERFFVLTITCTAVIIIRTTFFPQYGGEIGPQDSRTSHWSLVAWWIMCLLFQFYLLFHYLSSWVIGLDVQNTSSPQLYSTKCAMCLLWDLPPRQQHLESCQHLVGHKCRNNN